MKWKSLGIGFGALVISGCLLAAGFAAAGRTPQEMLKPGAEHEVFKAMVGEWDTVMTEFGPDQKTTTEKGSQTNTLASGGLFLVSDYKGKMAGADFHGHGINGWNPMKKKYENVWVDSMTPSLEVNDGEYDAKTKTLTFFMNVPGQDGKPMKCRQTNTVVDKDHMTFHFQMPIGDDKWTDLLKIDYTRRAAPAK